MLITLYLSNLKPYLQNLNPFLLEIFNHPSSLPI